MKGYNKVLFATLLLFALLFAGSNLLMNSKNNDSQNMCRVEIERMCNEISAGKEPDLSKFSYVTAYAADDGSANFWETRTPYFTRRIGNTIYRFEYSLGGDPNNHILIMNISVFIAALLTFSVLLYIRHQIIKPFGTMSNVPLELSRGNLTVPIKENKNKYFGKFVWGTDMLREKLEKQRITELDLHKEKQTMLLSISHDIKTPLSAISLYSKALSKGLYTDPHKLDEVYRSIGDKAAEIEKFVSELIHSADTDFLALDVNQGESYLSEIIDSIRSYYTDKLAPLHTKFNIGNFDDCIISCDRDRAVEVLQNVMENAVKYGDGSEINISFSDEEDHKLITVSNSGCTLPEEEVPHIFDSFWRGSNAGSKPGSGLGLYICRQLMMKMEGDIIARTADGYMHITAVFSKA